MQQSTVTLIVAGLGIGGTLGGITVGHFLTQSSQRKQWILDRRKEEWSELLTALAESLRMALKRYQGRVLSGEEEYRIVEAQSNCFRVIRDRIFIAADVKNLNLENRWSAAVMHHSENLDARKLGAAYDAIRNEIVEAATKRSR